MRTRQEVAMIIAELCSGIAPLFPQDKIEAIPLGSYARGDSDSGSDIDVLLLVCPQTEKNRGTLDFALQSPSAHINQLAFPTAASPFQRRSLLSSGDHLLQQPLTVLSSFGVNVAGLLFTVRSASENGQ